MVKLGHARIADNGKVSGGQKGDQTGKEVAITDYYSKPWKLLLRPKSSDIAERSAKACEDGCKNDKIGYSQENRNTAHTQAQKVGYDLSKINVSCETDCSAFMTLCAIAAGVKGLEYVGNAPTTSTMRNAFLKTGEYDLLMEVKYLTSSDYLKRGDILVSPGSHTAMVLNNGKNAQEKKQTVKVSYAIQLKSALNARKGAGKEYDKVFTFPKGMVLAICEECDGWGRITDIDAWISLNPQYVSKG